MNLQIGSNLFVEVTIPVLWGKRAIIQDQDGRISVIDLGESVANLEILADEPAPGREYRPTSDGFLIMKDDRPIYRFNSKERILTSIDGGLPEIQVGPFETRIGTSIFSGNTMSGMAVGIAVDEKGIAMGVSQLPEGLASLAV